MKPGTLRLETLAINRLKPAPYNPRIELQPGMPGWEKLERSLNEFQLVQPIVWNELTGHVVGGHQRLAILKHHGVQELQVAVVTLSLTEEQALNVALNNTRVGGDWDAAKLVDLLQLLDQQTDFDATLTGFSAEELRDLVLTPTPMIEESPVDGTTQAEAVKVTWEIPLTVWPTLRPRIDELLAEFDVPVHIELP